MERINDATKRLAQLLMAGEEIPSDPEQNERQIERQQYGGSSALDRPAGGPAPALKGPAVQGYPVLCMLDRERLSFPEMIKVVAKLGVKLEEMQTFMPMTSAEESMLVGLFMEARWSERQIHWAFGHVVKTKSWIAPGDSRPKIFPADLFKAPYPRVYGRPWFDQRTEAERTQIAQYWCPGFPHPVFGWIYELDGLLDRVRFTLAPVLPAAAESETEPDRDLVRMTAQYLDAHAKVEELQERNERERREWAWVRGDLQRQIERLEAQVANLTAERDDLVTINERLRAQSETRTAPAMKPAQSGE